MHRIDSSGNVAGQFNDDLAVSNPATRVSAAWMNDVQENLAGVIEGAGIALVKGAFFQLRDAIQVLFDIRGHKTGDVKQKYGTTVDSGWLKLDAAPHLKTDYPNLVTYLTGQGLLVDAPGDATRFVLVDARGYSVRNWDDGAGVDPGRGIATLQGDQFPAHTHDLAVRSNANSGDGYVEDADATGTARTVQTSSAGAGTEVRVKNIALMLLIKT